MQHPWIQCKNLWVFSFPIFQMNFFNAWGWNGGSYSNKLKKKKTKFTGDIQCNHDLRACMDHESVGAASKWYSTYLDHSPWKVKISNHIYDRRLRLWWVSWPWPIDDWPQFLKGYSSTKETTIWTVGLRDGDLDRRKMGRGWGRLRWELRWWTRWPICFVQGDGPQRCRSRGPLRRTIWRRLGCAFRLQNQWRWWEMMERRLLMQLDPSQHSLLIL